MDRSTETDSTAEVRRLLESESAALAAYVRALVGDAHAAEDLFQTTCLEVWRSRQRYEPGTRFGAWARAVARHVVLGHWRRAARARVTFSSAAMEAVGAAWEEPGRDDDDGEARRAALAGCLGALGADERRLVEDRYRAGRSMAAMAAADGRSEAALKMALSRIRRKLSQCIRAKLGAAARPGDRLA